MVVQELSKTNYATVKREVILQRMKKDLDSAVLWVPWKSDRGDVNNGAVYHLLAKIDLALGLFDDAIAAASAVISNGSYKLMLSLIHISEPTRQAEISY